MDARSRPSASEPPAKKARKPSGGLTKKELDAKLKAATQQELVDLVRQLQADHSEIMDTALLAFTPRLLPVKPADDDPLLHSCFHCGGQEELQQLHKSEPVQICSDCASTLYVKNPGTCTRDKLMSFFHFTKAEAEKISSKKTSCGLWGNQTCYVYKVDTIVKAVKAKYGSLYMMASKSGGR